VVENQNNQQLATNKVITKDIETLQSLTLVSTGKLTLSVLYELF